MSASIFLSNGLSGLRFDCYVLRMDYGSGLGYYVRIFSGMDDFTVTSSSGNVFEQFVRDHGLTISKDERTKVQKFIDKRGTP